MTETFYRGVCHTPDADEIEQSVDVRITYRGVSYVSINLPDDPGPGAVDLRYRSEACTKSFQTRQTLVNGPDNGWAVPAQPAE